MLAVSAALRQAGVDASARISRVPVGASNVVFEVVTPAGARLAAQVSTAGPRRYRIASAAMDRARPLGVPCPNVVAVTTIDDVGVMLAEWLPGERMSGAAESGRFRDATAWPAACGEVLARIHSLTVQGYGNLDDGGNGARPELDQWFVDDVRPGVDSALGRCDDRDTTRRLEAAYQVLDSHRAALRGCPSRLAHGDFSPMNLLVEGDRLTGVVDWESVKGGPAAFDFGWWDWFSDAWGTPFLTDAMVEAYRRHADVDLDQMAELRQLVVLRVLVGNLVRAIERGDEGAVAAAARRLRDRRLA